MDGGHLMVLSSIVVYLPPFVSFLSSNSAVQLVTSYSIKHRMCGYQMRGAFHPQKHLAPQMVLIFILMAVDFCLILLLYLGSVQPVFIHKVLIIITVTASVFLFVYADIQVYMIAFQ